MIHARGAPARLPRVLIVDDLPENIRVLNDVLKEMCERQAAMNGELALRLAHGSQPPDLILLDVVMPGMDGHEVCQRLKSDPVTREIPVIFVTGHGDVENETRGFALGAVDYITKPYNPAVIRARVKTHLELRQARRDLEEKNEALSLERGFIENIVTRMRESSRFQQQHLRLLETAVERTSGDFILSHFRPDGAQHLLLGDFTGHGLPAAIGAPIVSYIFYRLTSEGAPLAAILEEINTELNRKLPTGIYMAASLAEIDRNRQRIRVWNHGMPDALLFHRGKLEQRIPSMGIPLGIRPTLPAAEAPDHSFSVGDRLCLCSDGLTEARDGQEQLFGEERLARFLEEAYAADAPLEPLLETLRAFQGGREFQDDVTLLEATG